MENAKKIQKIKCAIFQAKNETIERITKAINEAENIKEKTVIAQRLLNEVEKLLPCEYFDEKRADCKICHYIAKLRKQTANLIIRTSRRSAPREP